MENGLTLVGWMIIGAIFLILAMVFLGAVGQTPSEVTYGINGVTESRCIEGYKFIVSQDGVARQIMDEVGRGVKCEVK